VLPLSILAEFFRQHPTVPRLLLALLLGSLIGVERQWRQRAAGLRTNTLVCLGAAGFVTLGGIVGGPETTNVIAYVVSGVGFLGAGAIMKEGGSIRGLNTAATLWCSAAVGAFAGAGKEMDASFIALLLLAINVVLRPVSRAIDRKSIQAAAPEAGLYRLILTCVSANEQAVSTRVMRSIAALPLVLRELRTEESEDTDEVLIQASVESAKRDKALVERLASQLKLDPDITAVEWAETSQDAD
jgi:putative Mg2+ transporter-C (MgtC) family protein